MRSSLLSQIDLMVLVEVRIERKNISFGEIYVNPKNLVGMDFKFVVFSSNYQRKYITY